MTLHRPKIKILDIAGANNGDVPTVDVATNRLVYKAPPAGGGGGGSGTALFAGAILPSIGNPSGSAFACKSHQFALYESASAVAVKAGIDTVSGASYKAGIFTIAGSQIQSVLGWTTTLTIPTGAGGDKSILTLRFAGPVSLAAGTTYSVGIVRTDSTATYALPVEANTSVTQRVDIGGRFTGAYHFFASANPAVGTAVGSTGGGSVSVIPVIQLP